MSCEGFERSLIALVEEGLPPEETAAVERHTVQCASCRAFAVELRAIRGTLESARPADPGDAFFAAARERIYAEHQRSAPAPTWAQRALRSLAPWVFAQRRVLAATAAAVAVLLGAVLWPKPPPARTIPGTQPALNGEELGEGDLQAELASVKASELPGVARRLAQELGHVSRADVVSTEEDVETFDGEIDAMSPDEMKRLGAELRRAVKEAKGA